MKGKTLWSVVGKKFTPRNKQAALIIRPAKGLHVPPDAIPLPRYALTAAQRVETENEARRVRIAIIEEKNREHVEMMKQRELKERANRKKRRAHPKIRVGVQLKKLEKEILNVSKRRGLPPPNPEQIQRALAGVCNCIHSSVAERGTHNPLVDGSIPSVCTSQNK